MHMERDDGVTSLSNQLQRGVNTGPPGGRGSRGTTIGPTTSQCRQSESPYLSSAVVFRDPSL